MSPTKKNVIYLGLSFVLPVLMAWAYFSYVNHFGGGEKTNYGVLLDPILTTEQADFVLAGGATLPKKWTLTYLNFNRACEENCQDLTKLLKRLRSLMNEDINRVQTLLVTEQNTVLTPEFQKDLFVLKKLDPAFNQFVSMHWKQKKDTILLLDPLGNIVLQYPTENLNLKKMHKDLLRLLKYSRIG